VNSTYSNPGVPVETELQSCQNELDTLLANNVKTLQDAMSNLTELQEHLQNLTDFSISMGADRQKVIIEKRLNIQRLTREIALAKTTLTKKFDCNSNNFTISDCLNYCTFPYAYDSCEEEPAKTRQKIFVGRILNDIGKDKHQARFYLNLFNSTTLRLCLRIHALV